MQKDYLEILVEEKTMEVFLKGVLPKILPDGFTLDENCLIRPHNGKHELKKMLPKIVRAYNNYPYPVKALIIQDQDSSDCLDLKNSLVDLVKEHNPNLNFLVRIACRELENWYLGDLPAVESIYPESRASKLIKKAKYRNPDRVNGSEEMYRFSKNFAKVSCARKISTVISIDNNTSPSFQQFCSGLKRLLN